MNKIIQEFNFPKNIIFSHPVAGSHLSGEINSVSGLFEGKSTVLSYHDSVTSIHVNRVRSLWESLGTKITVLDADLHDQIFAYTSHLPHAAAYALLKTLKGIDQDDLPIFSGGGLGEFLRLVSSSPEMWTDIFLMNEKNISIAIEELIQNLNFLKDQITNNEIVESDKEKQIHKLSDKSLILGTPSQFSSLELKRVFLLSLNILE